VLVALLVFGVARPAVSAPRLLPGVEVLHATGPKLLVLVAALDAPARSQAGLLEHVAETAVKSQGRFVLLRSADALDGRAARARQEAAEKAGKLDKEGRQKLDDLDAVAGANVLGEAVAAWRASDLTEHFKDLVSTWSARGGAYATGDENVKARQDIERILAVAPDAQFSNAWYPPDLLKYAEERRKQAMSSTGELTVRSEPVGARIWVDGVYRGVAPATVKGLPNGKHLVTALLAGRSMLMSEVALGEEVVKLEPAEGAAHWTRTLDKVAKDPNGEGRDTAARELAAATGAEQVLLLVAKKSVNGNQLEITGVRIEANDGHNAAWVQKTVPMDATEATDALVLSLLEKDAPRANGKPVTHFQGGGGMSTHRVVGIAVLGGGAALAITGAIFGGLALGKQAEFQNTVQIDTFAATQIANDGRTFAVVCDITLITGLVAAAAGAVLGFTPVGDILFKPKSAAPPPEEKKDEPAPKEEKKKDESAPPPKKEKKEEAPPPRKEEPKKEEPKKEEEPKKTKKQEAEERKKREAEEKKAREEEEKRKKEEEKRAKEEEEKRKKEEKKSGSKKKDEEEKKKKEEEEAAKKAEEEAAKKKADEEAARKKEEEAKKKKAEEEAAKKKAEEEAAKKKKAEEEKKKKDEDHDDLKNY
jgi:DNA segregation ATPase FtsK/SpoIIIE-like protein